jgi:hypothetical protein
MTKCVPPISAAALLFLTACGPSSSMPAKPPNMTASHAALIEDTASIEANVRLAAANKRIDDLTAEVDTLRTNPQTIELELLKQRLEALEAIVYKRESNSPKVADDAVKGTVPALGAANSATVPPRVRKPAAALGSSRPATRDETDAFAKGGK